jgi:hypothetical protein
MKKIDATSISCASVPVCTAAWQSSRYVVPGSAAGAPGKEIPAKEVSKEEIAAGKERVEKGALLRDKETSLTWGGIHHE